MTDKYASEAFREKIDYEAMCLREEGLYLAHIDDYDDDEDDYNENEFNY